jgi:zinc-binding alcohol dehydrogenase/oxidoreductase
MRAIVQREIGGPEVLRLEEVEDLSPGPGEVVVRLKAAALNRRDAFIRTGNYAGIVMPLTPGSDGAGEVAAVGEGVSNLAPGQPVVIDPTLGWGDDPHAQSNSFRILGLPDKGTYAQYVRVPAINVYPMPDGLSWHEAAAIPLAGLTAYRAVVTRAQVRPGDTVLVTGCGGGVATFALLYARHLGARTLVLSGSDEKLARAAALGADAGFNYHNADWVKSVRAASDGKGPDVVIDSVGGDHFNQVLDAVRPGGRVVVYGSTLGPVPNMVLRRVFWKQLDVRGSTMGSPAEFAAMLALFGEGKLRPAVDRVFPLAEAGVAQAHMEDAAQFGKIVLDIPA